MPKYSIRCKVISSRSERVLRKILIILAILTTVAFIATRFKSAPVEPVSDEPKVQKPKPRVARPAGPKPPNIVLIVIDTLRRDHLGCYGYSKDTTPNIDKLAAQGLRADEMIATCSWTIPSLMSIFTSLPPSLHQATYKTHFGAGITTLADELHGHGYQTAGFASNPFAKTGNGFALGFDVYTDFDGLINSDTDGLLNVPGTSKLPAIWEMRSSPLVTQLASKWLDGRNTADPFFLFALYFDAHADYVPQPPYDKMFDPDYSGTAKGKLLSMPNPKADDRDRAHIQALYDGEVRYTDEFVGKLIQKIDSLGLSKDTIVVVTSDHGEEFWDHGHTLHGPTLYDEVLRVPFILSWPGHVNAGTVLNGQISTMNIMPTMLDAAGARIPVQAQSPSLLNAFLGKSPLEPQFVIAETDYEGVNRRAVRTSSQKLIFDLEAGTRQVFDLTSDPREKQNLDANPTASAAELKATFDAWDKSIQSLRSTMEPSRNNENDQQTLEQLKQLGYGH
jgi:arylsulfatase A-like enzyme